MFKKWFDQNSVSIRNDYFTFLRFPSISSDPAYKKDLLACAEWLKKQLSSFMKAEIIETKGYPIVYAEDLSAGKEAETLLIYGHYDVQPVDPLELWKSDPFKPEERDGQIYARGAVDDKGQIFYAISAVKAFKELKGKLPINLKFCIEGEEESSSIGLALSLSDLKQKFKADSLLVIDFSQFDEKKPALSLGARGMLAMEVILTGSTSDLHSGEHGGIAYNPNKALVQLLSKLWDEEGRVVVPGFYDDVLKTTEIEKKKFAFAHNQKYYKEKFGIEAFGGEKSLSLMENNLFMPTLEINGMSGGYTGKGFKTVIPKEAFCKLSVRLVPNQDPEDVAKKLTSFLKKQVTKGIKIEVNYLGGEPAFRGRADSNLARAVSKAANETTSQVCQNVLSGASIPIMAKMIRELGCEIVGMGYCLPTDNIHAPNEHFGWDRFEKGFLTVAKVLELL
jgi:acetylornithine deacetylase/succinyl-diaminopimelate desuccinylase-like protein